MEESLEIIRTIFHNDRTWAIELKETGEVIGCIGYFIYGESNINIDENDAKAGYWIAKPYWNQGVCTDSIAVNTIVANKEGEVSSCDIPFCEEVSAFNQNYLQLTKQVAETCTNHDLPDSMVIGTSALAQYNIDGAVGMYSGIFNNPFLIWGKYKRCFFKTTLTVSFQFHHTQMDGAHAARFLEELQKIINRL